MNDINVINRLIHYMKGIEPFSKIFEFLIKGCKKWCPFQHNDGINKDCYNAHPNIKSLLDWIGKYLLCCKYLDVDKYSLDELNAILNDLKMPETMVDFNHFKNKLEIIKGYINYIEPNIHNKIDRFSCQECKRLDEALVCYQNYCFYSCVVMSVSAVECRIIEIVKRSDLKLYNTYFNKSTLGQLIMIFDESQYKSEEFSKIKRLLPDKHKPLVLLLNQYRVFSAHPTEEGISAQIAEAILQLSFTFLMDTETCPYEPHELRCNS